MQLKDKVVSLELVREHPIISECPECKEEEKTFDLVDGKCGVCLGTGYIEWRPIGKLTK